MNINTSSTPELNLEQSRHPQNFQTALISLMVLFFMMGFITCLNDILVPYLKKAFTLNYKQASLIQSFFFGAYGLISIPSSIIINKLGYKKGMILGFTGAAMGCLLFFPAVTIHSYPVFLFALFILASGIVLLQVTANPYVAILGPPETASARLTLNQAMNSVGTFIAPYFGTVLILSSLNDAGSSDAVKIPYLGIAFTLILISLVISRISLPEIKASDTDTSLNTDKDKYNSAWQHVHLLLGAVGIFMYVGAEVAIGSYLVNYLGLDDVAGLNEENAGLLLPYYWGGAMAGRFAGAYVLRIFSPGKVLAFNASAAITLILFSINTTGNAAIYSMIAVGLCNSIMFPTIFTLAVKGLGKHTNQGSGILSTAIVGGAFIPLLQATLADMEGIGLRWAFLVPAVCYLYIVWYGLKGHSKRNQK
ncbi:MAG TPA: sugar MFS transporter [Cytophagaceae bacterium]